MELSHSENDINSLKSLSVPYEMKKSDSRLHNIFYSQIRSDQVYYDSLYKNPISDEERTLGVTLLTVFSYYFWFSFSYFREDRVLSHTFLSNWKGYF